MAKLLCMVLGIVLAPIVCTLVGMFMGAMGGILITVWIAISLYERIASELS